MTYFNHEHTKQACKNNNEIQESTLPKTNKSNHYQKAENLYLKHELMPIATLQALGSWLIYLHGD